MTRVMKCIMAAPSNDLDRDPLRHVVVIAGRIGNELLDLRLTGAAGRPRGHDSRAGLARGHARHELAERIAAGITAERRLAPCAAAVDRDLDFRYPRAAVPRDPAHLDRRAAL